MGFGGMAGGNFGTGMGFLDDDDDDGYHHDSAAEAAAEAARLKAEREREIWIKQQHIGIIKTCMNATDYTKISEQVRDLPPLLEYCGSLLLADILKDTEGNTLFDAIGGNRSFTNAQKAALFVDLIVNKKYSYYEFEPLEYECAWENNDTLKAVYLSYYMQHSTNNVLQSQAWSKLTANDQYLSLLSDLIAHDVAPTLTITFIKYWLEKLKDKHAIIAIDKMITGLISHTLAKLHTQIFELIELRLLALDFINPCKNAVPDAEMKNFICKSHHNTLGFFSKHNPKSIYKTQQTDREKALTLFYEKTKTLDEKIDHKIAGLCIR